MGLSQGLWRARVRPEAATVEFIVGDCGTGKSVLAAAMVALGAAEDVPQVVIAAEPASFSANLRRMGCTTRVQHLELVASPEGWVFPAMSSRCAVGDVLVIGPQAQAPALHGDVATLRRLLHHALSHHRGAVISVDAVCVDASFPRAEREHLLDRQILGDPTRLRILTHRPEDLGEVAVPGYTPLRTWVSQPDAGRFAFRPVEGCARGWNRAVQVDLEP